MSALDRVGRALLGAAKERGLLKYGAEPGGAVVKAIKAENPLAALSLEPHRTAFWDGLRGRDGNFVTLEPRSTKDLLSQHALSASEPVKEYLKTQPARNYGVVDSLAARPRGGWAQKAYPWVGEIAASRKMQVVPDTALTSSNELGRSVNTIGTALRHENPVFIPHQSQLGGLSSVRDFMLLPTDQQAALLATSSNASAKQRLLNHLERQGDFEAFEVEGAPTGFLELQRKYGINPEGGSLGGLLTPQTSARDISEFVRDFRAIDKEHSLGENTLKRMNVIPRMESGKAIPDELLQGIYFAKGGLVPNAHC